MRTLLLLRHGKSDWGAGHETDADRPLAARGRDAARTMGRFIAAAGRSPEESSLDEMDRLWDQAKREERSDD